MMISQFVNFAGGLFAFAAAILWFISALVRTPETFVIRNEILESSFDNSVGAFSDSLDLNELGKALRRQSRWSARAAVCAGVAAFLSTLVLFFGPK